MLLKPKRIAFESQKDIVDYVARGIAPPRGSFDDFIKKVYHPDDDSRKSELAGKETFIPASAINNSQFGDPNSDEYFGNLISYVYSIEVKKTVTCSIIGSALLVGSIIATAKITSSIVTSKYDDLYYPFE